MSLKYTLLDNAMRGDGTFYPKVIGQKVISEKYFLELLSKETALTEFDLNLALEKMVNTLIQRLLEGDTVRTPIGIFKLAVKGGVKDPEIGFNPAENVDHQLTLRFRPSVVLKKALTDFSDFEFQENMGHKPIITKVRSLDHDEPDGFSPGEMLNVFGTRLVYDKGQADEGLFFIAEDKTETKVEQVYPVSSRNLHVLVPDLQAGRYLIRLRSRLGNQELRKSDHQGVYNIY